MHLRLNSSLFLAAAIALLLTPLARADGESSTIKFSDPAKPGKLKVILSNGDVSIQGADSAEISVKSSAKAKTVAPRKDGLRVLTETSSFTLSEKDNLAVLDYGNFGRHGDSSDFSISVPRSTSVVIVSSFGGDVKVGGITGDVEIKSLNGEVKLDGLSGGALVETMNGEIRASFASLSENKPLSFTSTNGEVVLRVPESAKANVRLRTQNGSILTDFDEKTLITKTEAVPSLRSPRAKTAGRSPAPVAPEAPSAPEAIESDRDVARAKADAAREAATAARDATKAAVDTLHAAVAVQVRNSVSMMVPLPPMTGGKLVSGTLNGGGPEIAITTMNGDVTLRKLK